jgi:hypothetical protein
MRRRVPEQPLRGSNITSVEIQTQDLLRKPLGQIAPVNVCDLFALAQASGLPAGFHKALEEFTDRISQEIAEIPDGSSWAEYVEELQGIPAERVPTSFRALLQREGEPEGRDRPGCDELLERWSAVEALEFELGEVAPKIEKRLGPASPAERSKSKQGASAAKPGAALVDPERSILLKQLILERVSPQLENGLKEVVLIAGTRHRAKERYPDLLPQEIISALKELKEIGQLQYSAGRWKRTSRW